MLKLTVDLHVVQYLEQVEATDDKVEKLSDNSLNFPVNRIHILIYDLFYREILEYMHSLIYFLLQK